MKVVCWIPTWSIYLLRSFILTWGYLLLLRRHERNVVEDYTSHFIMAFYTQLHMWTAVPTSTYHLVRTSMEAAIKGAGVSILQIGVGASNLLFLVIFTWKLHEIEKELDRVKFSYFQLIKKSQKKNQFTMAFSVMVATCYLCVENGTNAQHATTTTCVSHVRTRELTLSMTSFISSEIVT